jgi:hypothetical protein
MFEPGKSYLARDGATHVRIYAVDGKEGEEIHGAFFISEQRHWEISTWNKSGAFCPMAGETALDIVGPEV